MHWDYIAASLCARDVTSGPRLFILRPPQTRCFTLKVRRRSAFRILFSRQLIAGAHIRADVYDDDGLSCMHAEVAQLPDDPGSLQFCARKLGRRRCVAAAET